MSEPSVTQLLIRAREGDPGALPELIGALQNELRRLASAQMRQERRGHTLQTTALVNEAYVRLCGQTQVEWEDRQHFLAAAAQAMRRVLLQHARDRGRQKRGGGWDRIPVNDGVIQISEPGFDVLALDEALEKLEALDPSRVRLVELRFFAGLTVEEAAEVLGRSPATVKREWQVARGWLYREMQEGEESP